MNSSFPMCVRKWSIWFADDFEITVSCSSMDDRYHARQEEKCVSRLCMQRCVAGRLLERERERLFFFPFMCHWTAIHFQIQIDCSCKFLFYSEWETKRESRIHTIRPLYGMIMQFLCSFQVRQINFQRDRCLNLRSKLVNVCVLRIFGKMDNILRFSGIVTWIILRTIIIKLWN